MPLAVAAVVVWALGTFLFIYFWPRIVLRGYRRATLVEGFGDGPIPVNTLYTQPQALFADPLHASLPPGSSQLMSYGTNRDTLYVVGCLDLSKGPQVLHVPDMAGRYYAVQFTDPSDGTNFAYVGKRTTGTKAGDYLITGPGWKGTVPQGMKQIPSPNKSRARYRTSICRERQRSSDRLRTFKADTARAVEPLTTRPVTFQRPRGVDQPASSSSPRSPA